MSTQTGHPEIQEAMYARLMPGGALDAGLAAAGLLAVYDFRNVPQNQSFPYMTLGDGYEIPNNSLGRRGYIYFANIHIFSRYKGTREGDAILARLNELLDQRDLDLSTQQHVYTMYSRSLWLADPDGLTTHIAAQYKVFSEE